MKMSRREIYRRARTCRAYTRGATRALLRAYPVLRMPGGEQYCRFPEPPHDFAFGVAARGRGRGGGRALFDFARYILRQADVRCHTLPFRRFSGEHFTRLRYRITSFSGGGGGGGRLELNFPAKYRGKARREQSRGR